MATRIKNYPNPLSEKYDPDDWFSQFEYHLYEESLVLPVLPEDPTDDQRTEYDRMMRKIRAHLLTSISFEYFKLAQSCGHHHLYQ